MFKKKWAVDFIVRRNWENDVLMGFNIRGYIRPVSKKAIDKGDADAVYSFVCPNKDAAMRMAEFFQFLCEMFSNPTEEQRKDWLAAKKAKEQR